MSILAEPSLYAVTEALASGEIIIHITTEFFETALACYFEFLTGVNLTFHVYVSNEDANWYALNTFVPIEAAKDIFLGVAKDKNVLLVCSTNKNFLLQRPGDFSAGK